MATGPEQRIDEEEEKEEYVSDGDVYEGNLWEMKTVDP